jgi:hypothetical protein
MQRISLVALSALALASCGSSDSSSTTPAVTTTSTTTQAPKLTAPAAKLSRAEYKSVRTALNRLARLEHVKSLGQAVRLTKAGCRRLSVQTTLVVRIRSACVQAARTFGAIHALDVHKRECTQALNAGDVSCYSNLFRSIGRAARVSGVRERAMNSEIRRRKLHGNCAKALVSDARGLKITDAMTHDAISAANAAERRDGEAFTRAGRRLQQDLEADTGGAGAKESMRKLRACV